MKSEQLEILEKLEQLEILETKISDLIASYEKLKQENVCLQEEVKNFKQEKDDVKTKIKNLISKIDKYS